MALYGFGKHTFESLIKSVRRPLVKDFLKYKKKCHFNGLAEKRSFVEQMLYNESPEEIEKELSGFVAGRLFGGKSSLDFEQVVAHEELMPRLALIHKEMCVSNNWPENSWEEYE